MFDPTSENRCPSQEALEWITCPHQAPLGRPNLVQRESSYSWVDLALHGIIPSLPTGKLCFLFDKEKPKAEQADPQSWWELY